MSFCRVLPHGHPVLPSAKVFWSKKWNLEQVSKLGKGLYLSTGVSAPLPFGYIFMICFVHIFIFFWLRIHLALRKTLCCEPSPQILQVRPSQLPFQPYCIFWLLCQPHFWQLSASTWPLCSRIFSSPSILGSRFCDSISSHHISCGLQRTAITQVVNDAGAQPSPVCPYCYRNWWVLQILPMNMVT